MIILKHDLFSSFSERRRGLHWCEENNKCAVGTQTYSLIIVLLEYGYSYGQSRDTIEWLAVSRPRQDFSRYRPA